jgi:hypothetical protein
LGDIGLSALGSFFGIEGTYEELNLYEDGVGGGEVIVEDGISLVTLNHDHCVLNNNMIALN